jgi:hypothetical protein
MKYKETDSGDVSGGMHYASENYVMPFLTNNQTKVGVGL